MSQSYQEENKTSIQERKELGNCWRCGSMNVGIWNRVTVLLGGFHCQLCPDCQNDWEVYIRDHPARRELCEAEFTVQQAHAKTFSDGMDRSKDLTLLEDRKIEINKRLFAIAETWTQDMIERPAPEPPPPPTTEQLAEMRERRKSRLRVQMALLEMEEKEAKQEDKA